MLKKIKRLVKHLNNSQVRIFLGYSVQDSKSILRMLFSLIEINYLQTLIYDLIKCKLLIGNVTIIHSASLHGRIKLKLSEAIFIVEVSEIPNYSDCKSPTISVFILRVFLVNGALILLSNAIVNIFHNCIILVFYI